MKTLLFISKKYWLGNKVQLLQLCTVIILAVAALFCACLYGRSSLLAELEEELNQRGDYDLSVCYPDQEIAAYLEADSRFSETARVYRVGNIGPLGEEEFFVDAGYFEDQSAIDMFHLPLLEGRYPERQGELCVDQMTLQSWGYSARTGQMITLSVYDKSGNYQGNREYLITGIVKLISSDGYSTYTLRTHYIDGWTLFEAATPPLIYLSAEEGEALAQAGDSDYIFLGSITYTGEFDDNMIWGELANTFTGRIYLRPVIDISRSQIVASITLQGNFVRSRIGGYSPGFAFNERVVTGGNYLQMNFYNGFLIPCFTALLVLLTVCSVYSVLHLVLQKRSRQFGILRSVGMSMRQIITMLFLETGILLAGCIGLGYLLGAGIYVFSLKLQEILFGQKVFYAFTLDEFWGRYIRMVTYDPALLPWLVVVLSVVMVFAFYFGSHFSEEPLAMIQKERSKKEEKKRYHSIGISLMGGRHTGLVLLLAIVVGAVSFGYLSCRVQADKEAVSYQNLLRNVDVADYGYAALLNVSSTMHGYEQMMHGSGLDAGQAKALVSDEAVEEYVLYALNLSSKLVYGPDSEKGAFLSEGSNAYVMVEAFSDADNAFYAEQSRLTWEYRGFPDEKGIYQAPTLGLAEENLTLLAPYVVAGEIHPEKLVSGEEVILLAKEEEVCDYFSIGEILPLADVVFGPDMDEDEQIRQGMMPSDMEPAAYVGKAALFVIGERLDFPSRIGAIAVLDEAGQELFYGHLTVSIPDSGVRIVTTLEAMQGFGLPDHNYTNLYVNLKPGADRIAFENKWYSLVAKSKRVAGYNLLDIKKNMASATRASMLIFYCLFLLLAVIGAVSVYNLVTVILYNSEKKIAILKAVGGNRKQIAHIILKKAVWYPLLAGLLGFLVIYGYMGICWYAQNLINDNYLVIINDQYPSDWYWHFPIQLFWNYAPHRFLLGIIAFVTAVLLLFVAKQLRTLLCRDIPGELYRE